MRVACDAAESPRRVPGYLKLGLPALLRVCALLLRLRPGGCLLPFIHALISTHTPRSLWCRPAVERELMRGYMCSSPSLSPCVCHTRSPLPPPPLYIPNPLPRAYVCTHGLTRRSTRRWLRKRSYSCHEQTATSLRGAAAAPRAGEHPGDRGGRGLLRSFIKPTSSAWWRPGGGGWGGGGSCFPIHRQRDGAAPPHPEGAGRPWVGLKGGVCGKAAAFPQTPSSAEPEAEPIGAPRPARLWVPHFLMEDSTGRAPVRPARVMTPVQKGTLFPTGSERVQRLRSRLLGGEDGVQEELWRATLTETLLPPQVVLRRSSALTCCVGEAPDEWDLYP